jgi:peroxiredoxin
VVQAVAWNDRIEEVRALGYEVATVTYDAVPTLARFAARKAIAFPTLSDERSEVIRAFGLLNENYPSDSPYYGVPHPAIVVLDAQGRVSHRFTESGYVRRPPVDAVLDALRSDGGARSETVEGHPGGGLLKRLRELLG